MVSKVFPVFPDLMDLTVMMVPLDHPDLLELWDLTELVDLPVKMETLDFPVLLDFPVVVDPLVKTDAKVLMVPLDLLDHLDKLELLLHTVDPISALGSNNPRVWT